MNNLTATRIVKSVLQRLAGFDTNRYDYVRAPRHFYERLAEMQAMAGQWAEPRALEIFADMSPAQRAIHIVMDDDEISYAIMRSTVVARQQAIQLLKGTAVAGEHEKLAGHVFFIVPGDSVGHLSQEELVAAFLEDDSLTIVSEPEDQGEKPTRNLDTSPFIKYGKSTGSLGRKRRSPFIMAPNRDVGLSVKDLSMHFFGFGETSTGMTDLSRRHS